MTINRSDLSGLELALDAVSGTASGEVVATLSGLIAQAHAAPAAEPVAWRYDLATWKSTEDWRGFERTFEDFAPHQWEIDDGKVKDVVPLYSAAPQHDADWREHSKQYAKGEKCPETIETLQAAWGRDQELMMDQKAEISRLKEKLNRAEQRNKPHDAELIELLEELLESAQDGAVHKGEYLTKKYKEPELFERAIAKLATLKVKP